MDIGRDNGLVVDLDYEDKAPYAFTGTVKEVVFDLKPAESEDEQALHEHASVNAVQLVLDPVVDELADQPARGSPDRGRGERRRREQTHGEADTAAPAHPLATEVVARLPNGDGAVSACVTRMKPSIEILLSLTSATSPSKSPVASSMWG